MRVEITGDPSDTHEVSFTLREGDDAYALFYRSAEVDLMPCPEAFVSMALVPCMRQGWGLELDGPSSARFTRGIDRIQSIFRGWNRGFHFVPIRSRDGGPVSQAPSRRVDGGRVGLFFTGGVDSFYSLLKNRDEVTDLVFVHGFDIELDDVVVRAEVSKRLQEVAAAFDKRLIEVESNVREAFIGPLSKWGREAHGGVLASVAHLLRGEFRKIYIASTFPFEGLFPWGTHPATDPHWSTETLEFVHDGCESDRMSKVASIARSDLALRHLRVCFENTDASYNCGRCEKCMRTMIDLRLAGALERCTVFEAPLDLERVSRILGNDDKHRPFYISCIQKLESSGEDRELLEAVSEILYRPVWKERVMRFVDRRRRRFAKLVRKGKKRR